MANCYELNYFTPGGLPCFCHFGYISSSHIPHMANWHKDIELLAGTNGEGYVECEEENIHFCKGDVVVINSGISHRIRTDSHVEYYFLIIDTLFLTECGFDLDSISIQKKIYDKDVFDTFMKIVDITHSDDKFRVLKTRLHLSELMLLLFESFVKFSPASEENHKEKLHSKKAIEYIQNNYAKPLTVEKIAEYVGVGRTRLSKEFKAFTGVTLLEQINDIRCKNARNFILSGINVSEAAKMCGFDNMSYFTKTYKKYVGELPTKTKSKTLSEEPVR